MENIIGDLFLQIDEGFYIEAYTNPEGIRRGDSVFLTRFLLYIDEAISYEDLLSVFQNASVKNGTLTLSIIPCSEMLFQSEREESVPVSIRLNKIQEKSA